MEMHKTNQFGSGDRPDAARWQVTTRRQQVKTCHDKKMENEAAYLVCGNEIENWSKPFWPSPAHFGAPSPRTGEGEC